MERAAPPDDGGERGSFTLPRDALVTSADDRDSPPLHRDVARTSQDVTSSRWGLVVGVVLVVLSLLLFGIYAPTP